MEVELPIFKIVDGRPYQMTDADIIHKAADHLYGGDIKKLIEEWFEVYKNGNIYRETELKHDIIYKPK